MASTFQELCLHRFASAKMIELIETLMLPGFAAHSKKASQKQTRSAITKKSKHSLYPIQSS
jgi:hypothetical protein